MRYYLLILPVALMVAFSQLIVKWRAGVETAHVQGGLLARLMAFLGDPFTMSGYVIALLASFAWLFVVARLPLSTAFPIYIGSTFLLVMLGSCLLLGEPLGWKQIIAAGLILGGIVLGTSQHG